MLETMFLLKGLSEDVDLNPVIAGQITTSYIFAY
ncbi:MAG: hypothetical protein JWP00_4198 [Chloroflexi bacterium]|jgi:hypothetical protein|nr:hypothetical protein [Chloroflexota bacterium]